MKFDRDMSYEEARELKATLESLLQHAGWKVFESFLEERAHLRAMELTGIDPDTPEKLYQFAKFRGGIEELQLIVPIIHQLYSDVASEVTKHQKAMEGDQDEYEG